MAGKNTQAFDNTTFEKAVSDGPVLVDFWAEWCGPCRALRPTIDEIADEFAGKIVVGKVDVDANVALGQRFGVNSIPTVILFVDGEVRQRFVGINPKETYTDALKELVESVSSA